MKNMLLLLLYYHKYLQKRERMKGAFKEHIKP